MENLSHPYITAVVNGLITTSIIWMFWTPFIIFIAVPVLNAMVKDFFCGNIWRIYDFVYYSFGPEIVNSFVETLPYPPTIAQSVVNMDRDQIKSDNSYGFIAFVFTSAIVISMCFYFAYYFIQTYQLDSSEIIKFNIVMFFVISIIEMVFFAGVATKYVPFSPAGIPSSIQSYSDEYLSSILPTSANFGPGKTVLHGFGEPTDIMNGTTSLGKS